MSTVIFVGPTLTPDAIDLAAELRGPARQGDVLRAMRDGFETIAIIDGYFDQVLPVWHKEILWALHHGKCVWGASSMGALRAAELDRFGMRGAGRIYEALRDGLLEDDDEVVLAHAGPEHGYRKGSEALVNIRVTLRAAVAANVLDRGQAERFVRLARARYYPDRTYRQLLEDARRTPELATAVGALSAWLEVPEHLVDQKALDAQELIAALRSPVPVAAPPQPFAFAYTEAFHMLRQAVGQP